MRKFFRKLFNVDQVEALKLEVEALRNCWTAEAIKREKEVEALYKELKVLRQPKGWKVVDRFERDKLYFVVTQGGFYTIKGWRLLGGVSVSEVTKRAVKNGFVVETREEAQALQQAMQALVGKVWQPFNM